MGWVRRAVLARNQALLLQTLRSAPHAARAHPTAEHLLPLFVAAGAGAGNAPISVLDGGISHGVLSMESYLFGTSGAAEPPTNTGGV